ncbi:MAG: nuclear transport factor 2 family protein [Calditrichia bacterium]
MRIFTFAILVCLILWTACTSPDLKKLEEDQISRDANIETVSKFFKLLEEEKIRDFIDLFAENGKQVNPYHSGLFPAEIVSRDSLYAFWKNVPDNFDGMQFPIEEILPFQDPDKIAAKLTGKIKLKGNAAIYENEYLCIFYFDSDGKIMEYYEYFNPLTAARGFGLLDQIN